GQDERLYDTGGAIRALEQNDPALAAMMKAHNAYRQD
ncbi:FMN-binding negative transcriptional regulator, partial [Mesorhizobium sp. M7A.F.Ca.ET.027.03.2.1]